MLKEEQKVFPFIIKVKPSEKKEVIEPPKVETVISKATAVDVLSIPGYEEVMKGLKKDKEGKHKEGLKFYEKAGKLGNKAVFLNMGNN